MGQQRIILYRSPESKSQQTPAFVSAGLKLTARKFMAMLSATAVVVAGLTVGVAGPAQATTAIGDVGPGGGIVFITPSTPGNSTGQYFEAAPNTWDGSAPDGTAKWCAVSNTSISGLGTAIGTGVTNSATIDTTCASIGAANAAEYVRAKTIGGLSDWFLPSQDEMLALYDQRASLTGVYATNQAEAGAAFAYLTSSQGTNSLNATAVFMQGAPDAMPPGTTGDTSKSSDRSLRPVRMFEPAITPSVGTVSATVNTAITPVTFTAAGFGTEIITYTVAPTLPTGLSLNAGTGEISGTPTVAIAAADYVVTATGNGDPATTATATINITITAGAAAKLAIATPPSASTASGVVFAQQPAIQLLDASDNVVSQNNVVVTAAIASGDGTLSGTLTATTNGSGVATFSGLSITGGTGIRTLTFTSPDLTEVTSANITVTAAAIAPGSVPTPATPTTPVTPAPAPISPVTPVVPVVLSPAQFMLGLTPTQVQGFTGDELAALPPAAFAVMSRAQVKALNPAQMSGFSAAQIQAIPARSLRAMKPVTLKKFSVTQIRALTQEQASDLRVKQIKVLGPVKRKIVNSKR